MKTLKIIILFVCTASLFTACSKEEEIGGIIPDNREAIRFEIGFTSQGTGGIKTRTATDKIFNTAWEEGDEIGVFAVEHAAEQPAILAASDNYMHNVKLTYNKAANTWTPDTPLYFPTGEDRQLNFYAYYPYSAAAIDPAVLTFNVQTDQNGSGFNASDLMFAVAWDVNKGSAVSLAFNHALSLVEVDISESSENTPLYVADKLKVQLCGVKTASMVNLSFQPIYPVVISASAFADIRMHRVDMGDAAKYVYRALIPRQDLAAGHTLFTFKQDLNGNDKYTDGNEFSLSYTLAAQPDLVPGNVLRYKIKLVETAAPDALIYAVGDYYPHVGRVVGVVFEVAPSGTSGKMVSLDEGHELQWSSSFANHGAISRIDGYANTNIIKVYKQNNPTSTFPAFEWCIAKGARWYLPAQEELLSLYDQKVAVNVALAGIGGAVPLSNNIYWSSSEFNDNYAWFVDFPNRNNTAYYKTESYRVRAVSKF